MIINGGMTVLHGAEASRIEEGFLPTAEALDRVLCQAKSMDTATDSAPLFFRFLPIPPAVNRKR